MINIFTAGTAQLKQEIVKNTFDPRHFFYKLLALSPGLKIREQSQTLHQSQDAYENFKKYLLKNCTNINQILDLSLSLCENYNFYPYYKSSYLELKSKLTSYTLDLDAKIHYIKELNVNTKQFQTELRYFLLLSGLYTFSMSPVANTATLPKKIMMLCNDTITETAASELAKIFIKQAEDFLSDGLNLTAKGENARRITNYIGIDLYPRFFQKEKLHRKINSAYDVPILNGLIQRKNNLFYKTLKFNNSKKSISKESVYNCLTPFITYPDHKTFDAHAMTNYLLERIFNFNFLYTAAIVYHQTYTYITPSIRRSKKRMAETVFEKLFNDMLSFLFFYPLPRYRLFLLDFISKHLVSPSINFSLSYINGFFHQTFVYFPLVDILFTYLLKLYYISTKNDLDNHTHSSTILTDLKNALNISTYSEYFKNYQSFTENKSFHHIFTGIYKIPALLNYININSQNIKIIEDCATELIQKYMIENSGPFRQNQLQSKSFEFSDMMNSFNQLVFSDIEKFNQHIITSYSLPKLNYVPVPFAFFFTDNYVSEII